MDNLDEKALVAILKMDIEDHGDDLSFVSLPRSQCPCCRFHFVGDFELMGCPNADCPEHIPLPKKWPAHAVPSAKGSTCRVQELPG